MAVQAGTAYVDFQADLSTLQKQVGAAVAPLAAKFGPLGKAAAIGIGSIAVAGAAAGVALYKIGESFDDAYDTIRTGTGATGKELDKLKGSFKNVVQAVPTDFGSAADAITDVNRRLGLTGKPLEALSKQFLELSRITGTDLKTNIASVSRAFVDWEVPVRKQGEVLDGFFRISQETGISVDDLASSVQKFGSPLRNLGFTLEESAAMFGTFEKAGVNTQTMVPGLKLAIANLVDPTADLSKKLAQLGVDAKKPDDQLRQVFALLSGDGLKSTEKMSLAMDVFGSRAGADLAEAVKQGRFEVSDLIDVFKHGSETIRGAGRDTMDFSEHWEIFKNKVFVALEPLAIKFFDFMGKAMEWLSTDGIRAAKDFGDAVMPIFHALVDVARAVFNALGKLPGSLGTIAQGLFVIAGAKMLLNLGSLSTMLGRTLVKSAGRFAVVLATRVGPALLAIAPELAIVAAGVVAVYEGMQVGKKLADSWKQKLITSTELDEASDGVRDFAEAAAVATGATRKVFKDLSNEVETQVGQLVKHLTSGGPKAKTAATQIGHGALAAIEGFTGDFGSAGRELIDAFASGQKQKEGAAKNAGADVARATKNGIGDFAPEFKGVGEDHGDKYAGGVGSREGTSRNSGFSIGRAAKQALADLGIDFKTEGEQSGDKFAGGLGSKDKASGSAGQTVGGAAKAAFAGVDFKGAGADAGDKFASGIKSVQASLVKAAIAVGTAIGLAMGNAAVDNFHPPSGGGGSGSGGHPGATKVGPEMPTLSGGASDGGLALSPTVETQVAAAAFTVLVQDDAVDKGKIKVIAHSAIYEADRKGHHRHRAGLVPA